MQATKKDLTLWAKCRADGKKAVGEVRLAMAHPHGTYAKLLPYLEKHWAITTDDRKGMVYSPDRSNSPDVRDTLRILEELHTRIAAATCPNTVPATVFGASLHCRYLYIILHQTPEKKIPHFVFHEIDGLLGTLRKSCRLLEEKGKMEPVVPPGFAAVVIHIEMRLCYFLQNIAWATHYKQDKEHPMNWSPYEGLKARRKNLVAHIRMIDKCLENGKLPSADEGDVYVVTKPPMAEPIEGTDLWRCEMDNGEWGFEMRDCLRCLVVPEIRVRMAERLGYDPKDVFEGEHEESYY